MLGDRLSGFQNYPPVDAHPTSADELLGFIAGRRQLTSDQFLIESHRGDVPDSDGSAAQTRTNKKTNTIHTMVPTIIGTTVRFTNWIGFTLIAPETTRIAALTGDT